MNAPRTSERRETVSAMMLPGLKRELQAAAARQDRSMGYLIEQAVKEYLVTHRPPLFPNQPQTFEL